jgi:diguanylate cyclase (GGDEF)-like protein/PAS domain S-box-containing protein
MAITDASGRTGLAPTDRSGSGRGKTEFGRSVGDSASPVIPSPVVPSHIIPATSGGSLIDYRAKLIDALSDGFVFLGPNGRIEAVSQGAERLFGIDGFDYIGATVDRLISGVGEGRRRRKGGTASVTEPEPIALAKFVGRHDLQAMDGSTFTASITLEHIDDDGRRIDALIVRDVSDHRGLENRLQRVSTIDSVTGLWNRTACLKRIEDELVGLVELGGKATLVHMDIDRFKAINDVFGHEAGDRLMKSLASRLNNLLDPRDLFGRLGGDELVVLRLTDDPMRAAAQIEMMIGDALARPFIVNGAEVFVTMSMGAATFPDHAGELDQLLQNAEAAAYSAKARGRNNCQIFKPGVINLDPERFRLETELRKAFKREKLSIAYQPRVDVQTGVIRGMEALLRWNHTEFGAVPPAVFVPIAEEAGLIDKIGDWILEAACVQAKTWVDAGLPKLKLAVNLSPRQFRDAGLAQRIASVLRLSGLPADRLELEITESSLMHDVERVVDILHELKRTGVSIAVDDFGTGYSSLSYLKRFPIDVLKIDKSFISGIPGDRGDIAISTAIIAMAKSLGLRVVAEGVEEAAQLKVLQDLGCDEAQGYLFSRPLTPGVFGAAYGPVANDKI